MLHPPEKRAGDKRGGYLDANVEYASPPSPVDRLVTFLVTNSEYGKMFFTQRHSLRKNGNFVTVLTGTNCPARV